MVQVILLIIILPLLVFWAWMFKAMTENASLPQCFITITNGRDPRLDWTLAFVILSAFAAFFYYVTEYRNQ